MRQNPSLAQFPTQILLFWSSWTLGRMSSLWELELSMEPGRDGSVSSWAGDETFRALVLRWKRAAALCLLPTQAGTCCWCCFSALGKAQCPNGCSSPLSFLPLLHVLNGSRANPSQGWQESALCLTLLTYLACCFYLNQGPCFHKQWRNGFKEIQMRCVLFHVLRVTLHFREIKRWCS